MFMSTYWVSGHKKCVFLSAMPTDWPTGRSSMVTVPTETARFTQLDWERAPWMLLSLGTEEDSTQGMWSHFQTKGLVEKTQIIFLTSGSTMDIPGNSGTSRDHPTVIRSPCCVPEWPPTLCSLETTRDDNNLCCPWHSLRKVVHWVLMC